MPYAGGVYDQDPVILEHFAIISNQHSKAIKDNEAKNGRGGGFSAPPPEPNSFGIKRVSKARRVRKLPTTERTIFERYHKAK